MTARALVERGDPIARRIVLVTGAAMVLAALVLAVYSVFLFEKWLAPEVDAKSLAVARSLQLAVDRAVGYGIPFAELQGMDAFLDETLAENRELAAIEIVAADGAVRYARQAGTGAVATRAVRMPVAVAAGEIVLYVKADYARNKLLEILADTVIMLFVAVLLAFELLPYIVRRGLRRRLDSRAAPTDIRLPMFVFVLAELLCLPFFPLYVRELHAPIPGFAEQTVIALPIAMYMLFVALGTMFGGNLVARVGAQRVFRWGVALAAGGYLGLALAHSLYDLLLWRILAAVGYALGTLACQAYVAEITSRENRTRAMSVFIGAVMVAAVCGAAIGGVLADMAGYRSVFAAALLLCLLSLAVFPTGVPEARAGMPVERTISLTGVYGILAADRGFAAVVLLAAIPAKLLFAAAVYFLTPLYLAHQDFDAATIGRCIMVYYLPMAFAGPLTAWIADRYGLRLALVVGGGALAGLGAAAALQLSGLPAILVAMACLGLGQVLATAPMFALALDVGARATHRVGQANALAAIRVLERIGSVIGPLLAGVLVALADHRIAFAVLGGIMLVCSLLLPLALRGARR